MRQTQNQSGARKTSVGKKEKTKLKERTQARLSGSSAPASGRKGKIPVDKELKVIGHQLKPCVIVTESSVAEEGLNETIITETKARLEDHELIKIKVRFTDRDDRQEALNLLIQGTGARLVHQIGKVALLFKASSQFSAKLSNIERHRQLL